jgi:hypothetical protein
MGFDKDASITGDLHAVGQLDFNKDAYVTGNLYGNHDIWLAKDGFFDGDVSAGLGHSLTTQSGVTITGSTIKADHTISIPGMSANPGGSHGSQNLWYGNGSTESIDAGSYRDLSVSRESTITLAGGTYDFRSVWVDKESEIRLDTSGGDIVINVHHGLSTGEEVTFNRLSGNGQVTINVLGQNMWLGKENQLEAHVTVYDGDFGADQGAELTGTFHASRNLWLDKDANVMYSPANGFGGGGQPVPEPATLALLALGGGTFLAARRRVRRARA